MLETNKIYNISWQDGFKQIEDNQIDLFITSPPYNLGGKFHTGNTRYNNAYNTYNDTLPEDEYQLEQIEFLNSCYDKLNDNGSMFYNHKPRIKNGICIHPLQWILKSKFILKQEIIWRNGSQNFDKIRFYPMTERVYWLVKNPKTKLFNEVGFSDLWEFKNVKRNPDHNATFPVELPQIILKCFKEAKLVCDPYGGIATTAIACKSEDKEYIIFEIDNKYCELGNKRLHNYITT